MKLPWSRKGNDAAEVRGVVATAAVKAQAQVLVDDLHAALDRLDEVLRDEVAMGDNGRHERRRDE